MFALTQHRRRVLFWIMVAIFIVVTPLIVGYARGYRFDFDLRKVTQIGGIAVETEPDDALVFIDGKYVEDDTPTFIRALLPQHSYLVRVEKAGYMPWEKTLEVLPRQVSVARNIILFPTELTFENSYPEAYADFYVSPNGETLFEAATTTPYLINMTNGATTSIPFGDSLRTVGISNISWHENSSVLIFKRELLQRDTWHIYDLRTGVLTNVTQLLIANSFQNISLLEGETEPEALMFYRNNGTRLLALFAGNVHLIDLREQTITSLALQNISRLSVPDGRIFVVTEGNALIETDVRGVEIRSYGTLPFAPVELTLSPDEKKLLYRNESSAGIVWLEDVEGDYRRKQGDIDNVLKTNSPIRTIAWHQDSNYLLTFLSDGTLFAAEIDIRDRQNIHRWTLPDATHLQYIVEDAELLIAERRKGTSRLRGEF